MKQLNLNTTSGKKDARTDDAPHMKQRKQPKERLGMMPEQRMTWYWMDGWLVGWFMNG